jgi:four helix bundle protein
MKANTILVKSKAFAIRIIRLYQYVQTTHKEYVLSKQLLRSGTAVGALIREAEHAQSKSDFLNKTNVALKEANETLYWLELLAETNYLTTDEYESIAPDAIELLKMLISIVKTTKIALDRK